MTSSDLTLSGVFARTKGEGRAALIPYVTAGHPHLNDLPHLITALNEGGADIVEIGIPFSDPLADGPVLQHAATKALNNGTKLRDILAQTKEISHTSVPIVYLTYMNPVYHFGIREFIRAAAQSGVKGLIIPDLPWLESQDVFHYCEVEGISLIPLVAPTSTDAHIASLEVVTGFVYGVSLTGVTGVRQDIDSGVEAMVARIKRFITQPVAIGFGISTPEHARQIGAVADGVIVGSALVRIIDDAGQEAPQAAQAFVASLREALNP